MSFLRNFARTTFKDFERLTIPATRGIDKVVQEIPRQLVGIEDLAVQVVSGGRDELTKITSDIPKPARVARSLKNLAVGGIDKIERIPLIDTAVDNIKLEGIHAAKQFRPDGPVVQGLVKPVIAKAAAAKRKVNPVVKKVVKKVAKKVVRRARKSRAVKAVKKVAVKAVAQTAQKAQKGVSELQKLKTGIMKSKDVRKFIVANRTVINKMKQADKVQFLKIAKDLL